MKVIKRTRKWTTKSGEKREKTYYYEVTKTSEGKQKFTRFVTAKKQTKILDDSYIEKRLKRVEGEGLKRTITNRINQIKKQGKELTKERLEQLIEQEQISKEEQFIRNLGYSKEEFAEQFKLTEEDLLAGKFKNLNDGSIKFIAASGKVFTFSWDYDRGMTLV